MSATVEEPQLKKAKGDEAEKAQGDSEITEIQANLWPDNLPNDPCAVAKIYNEGASDYEDNSLKDGYIVTFDSMRSSIDDALNSGAKVVLDAGCATGLLTKVYDFPTDVELHGADISADCLALAKTTQRYSSLQEADLMGPLPFKSDMFDLIVCNGVLGYCKTNQPIAELIRVLKPGCHLLMTFRHAHFLERSYDKLFEESKVCELVHQVVFDPYPNNPAYTHDYTFAMVRKTISKDTQS